MHRTGVAAPRRWYLIVGLGDRRKPRPHAYGDRDRAARLRSHLTSGRLCRCIVRQRRSQRKAAARQRFGTRTYCRAQSPRECDPGSRCTFRNAHRCERGTIASVPHLLTSALRACAPAQAFKCKQPTHCQLVQFWLDFRRSRINGAPHIQTISDAKTGDKSPKCSFTVTARDFTPHREHSHDSA